jgi:hypothetical protein
MQQALNDKDGWRSTPWRIAAWSAVAGLMLVPLAAQLVSGGFGWSSGDFVFVAVVLFASCFIFDLAARRAPNFAYLAGAAAALAAGFGLFVVNGAVGLVGSESEPHNLLFGAAILVALVGAVISRGRAAGMARAMLAAAVTHVGVSSALLVAAGGASDADPRMEILGLAIFATVWLASAWLFRRASK